MSTGSLATGTPESVATPRVAGAGTVVIFGATGDLARRKLLPALLHLASSGALPDSFKVVGVGRRPQSDDAYRRQVCREQLQGGYEAPDDMVCNWFADRLFYAFQTLEDIESYRALATRLSEIEGSQAPSVGRVYYLATPPSAIAPIVERLGSAGLLAEDGDRWRRVIVEKPFGYDLSSARALNEKLRAHLAEHQIYRIDHYLGKETVQNIMALRFANGIFEPIWNRRYVDQVQITVAETVGVESRGSYYDEAGALRDMVQNHLFQLLALTAMEPPISFRADDARDERVRVLHAIRICPPEEAGACIVRGQYTAANAAEGPIGYRQEPRVAAQSTTETYVALKLLVENWRWADVPFYLRTGKRLPRRASQIAVQFRRPPLQLFRDTPVESLDPNLLVIRIQPDEGISLRFQAKVPGAQVRLGTVDMSFSYANYFAKVPATGYETLLYDCLNGDQTLFHREDMVLAGWRVVEPILDAIKARPSAFLHDYPALSWGPAEADRILAKDGREWCNP